MAMTLPGFLPCLLWWSKCHVCMWVCVSEWVSACCVWLPHVRRWMRVRAVGECVCACDVPGGLYLCRVKKCHSSSLPSALNRKCVFRLKKKMFKHAFSASLCQYLPSHPAPSCHQLHRANAVTHVLIIQMAQMWISVCDSSVSVCIIYLFPCSFPGLRSCILHLFSM